MANDAPLLEQLRVHMPLKSERLYITRANKSGLVVVDEINGFCTVGMGNMAPRTSNSQITQMVDNTTALALQFSKRECPIIFFCDTHEADKPEPPYPPHCIRGTGEELLVPELKWAEIEGRAVVMEKDCINGFVGGMRADGSNVVVNWIKDNGLKEVVVVGICTDICVMDFVLTLLSARNHGLLGVLENVYVDASACATYDLPREVAETSGMGAHSAHPQMSTHHMGLYFMHMRGAILVDKVEFSD